MMDYVIPFIAVLLGIGAIIFSLTQEDRKTTRGKKFLAFGIALIVLGGLQAVKQVFDNQADAEERRKVAEEQRKVAEEHRQAIEDVRQEVKTIASHQQKEATAKSHVTRFIEQFNLPATLKKRYPYGYAIVGYEDTDLVYRAPEAVSGVKHEFHTDWGKAKLVIDKPNNVALLTLRNLDWIVKDADGKEVFTGKNLNLFDWSIPLKSGEVAKYPVGVPGPAEMVMEVLDPSPDKPVFVVGLRDKSKKGG